MAQEKPQQQVDMAPDPEEDDLDDLDDVLDEFKATTISQPASAVNTKPAPNTTSASGPGRPATDQPEAQQTPKAPSNASTNTSAKDALSDQDFAQDLQAGMASLIDELDANPDVQREFEKMMQELIAAGGGMAPGSEPNAQNASKSQSSVGGASGKPATGAAQAASGGPSEDKFQDTIRRTMERMQASGDAATAATSSGAEGSGSEEDFLAQMMRELTEGGGLGGALGGAGGLGGEGGLNAMLLSMMAQLTHKDILYEPMKELHDKFPAWMETNRSKVDAADAMRYEEQQKLVAEIVGRFEKAGYSDESEADREYIVERMQKMQAAGSPPPDLVGDMNSAQEALEGLDAGCPTQ